MDFIIGIIFVLLIIFIIINYTSVSVSNNNNNDNNLKDINYLYTNKHNMKISNTIPLPIQKNNSINNKLNLEEQSYDYKTYFYI